METREETVRGLQMIREEIISFLEARARQVETVNNMRTAQLVQRDEYDDSTVSHKFLQIAFTIMIFSVLTTILGDLIVAIFGGRTGSLINDLFLEFIFLTGFFFLLFRRMNGHKDSWLFPALIVAEGILLVVPLQFMANLNIVTVLILILSVAGTYFIVRNRLDDMVAFVNSKIKHQNEQHRKDFQAVLDENLRLEVLYQEEGKVMDRHRERAEELGRGWYPQDYYTLDAVNYLLHAFNNFKADTIKEAIQLYDTHLDRQARRAFEAEMIELEKEQIINQERMIELQEHANVLRSRQIAATQEAAAASREAASATRALTNELQRY